MKQALLLTAVLVLISTWLHSSDFLSVYPLPGSECGGAVTVLKNGRLVQAAVDFTTNGEDILVLTTDNGGNLLNAKRIGSSGSEQADAVLATQDGGVVIAGSINTGNGRGEDGLLVKLNAAGGIAWKREFGSAANDFFSRLVPSRDGGFFAFGHTEGSMTSMDMMVVRFASSGNAIWKRTLSTPGFDHASGITATPDGGVAVIAAVDTTAGRRTMVAKITPDGRIAWTRSYGADGNHTGASIVSLADGRYAITEIYSAGTGPTRTIVALLDSNGIPAWSRVYQVEAPILASTPDGGYLLAGNILNSTRGVVLKLDPSGKPLWRKSVRPDTRPVLFGNITMNQGDALIGGCVGYRTNSTMDTLLLSISQDGVFDGGCSHLAAVNIPSGPAPLPSSPASFASPAVAFQTSVPSLSLQSIPITPTGVCPAR